MKLSKLQNKSRKAMKLMNWKPKLRTIAKNREQFLSNLGN